MKLRSIVLVALLMTVALVAVGFGVAILIPEDPAWLVFVASLSAMALVLVPIMAGVTIGTSTFDPDTADGRKGTRRLVQAFAAFDLVAAIGAGASVVAVPATAPLLMPVVAVSVVLLVMGVRLGGRVQRRTVATAEQSMSWTSWSPSVVRRKVMRIVLVFVLVTILAIAAVIGFGIALDEGRPPSATAVLVGVGPGLLAASIACMVVSWPLGKDLRRVLGHGYTEQKSIIRVVLRGKGDELSEDARSRAAVYAQVAASYLPFQVAQFVLLFGGIWLQQLGNLSRDGDDGLLGMARVIVVAYPVLVAILVPMLVVQTRRARRYAAAHAHLLPATGDPLAPAASASADQEAQAG